MPNYSSKLIKNIDNNGINIIMNNFSSGDNSKSYNFIDEIYNVFLYSFYLMT